jgi:hypothetical protein
LKIRQNPQLSKRFGLAAYLGYGSEKARSTVIPLARHGAALLPDERPPALHDLEVGIFRILFCRIRNL